MIRQSNLRTSQGKVVIVVPTCHASSDSTNSPRRRSLKFMQTLVEIEPQRDMDLLESFPRPSFYSCFSLWSTFAPFRRGSRRPRFRGLCNATLHCHCSSRININPWVRHMRTPSQLYMHCDLPFPFPAMSRFHLPTHPHRSRQG